MYKNYSFSSCSVILESSYCTVSNNDSSCSSHSTVSIPQTCSINSNVKKKLKELIKQQPNGLWCCNLPKTYFELFNYELNYKEFG